LVILNKGNVWDKDNLLIADGNHRTAALIELIKEDKDKYHQTNQEHHFDNTVCHIDELRYKKAIILHEMTPDRILGKLSVCK
jgi:uncharacterized protein (DUF1015 family)